MKKLINTYSIIYVIHLILNAVCMGLVYHYYTITTIPQWLYVGFGFDLAVYIIVFVIEALLLVFFVITLILLIASLKQSYNGSISSSIKRLTIILPLVFVFLLPFSFGIPVAATRFEQIPSEKLDVASTFKELSNEQFEVDTYSICEKNQLGKAGYFEKQTFLEKIDNSSEADWLSDSSEGDVIFVCSYQESDYKFINDKFERNKTEDYALKNSESHDNYILYYEQDENRTTYYLIIEDNNVYFLSQFESNETDYFNSYTKENFVKDSLEVFNICHSF